MNAVYSKQYKTWKEKCSVLFVPEHRLPSLDRTIELADGFSVCFQFYTGEIDGLHLHASENKLLDREGQVCYTWRNLNNDCEFASLFQHRNGQHYLLFRIDLYGYGVYELESKAEFHYIPSEAYPEEGEKFQETFIWTSADYDAQSNLLAVCGCFWACPLSVIILDFSNPLREQPVEQWFDMTSLLDPDYELYDGIEFDRWEKGELCLRGDNLLTNETEELRLSLKQLYDAMTNGE